MPTAFTHAFVGGTLAGLAPSSVPRARAVACLALLAAAPDLDVLAFGLGIPYAHPLGHRGLTHSLPFAVGAGLAAAALIFPQALRDRRAFWRMASVTAAAIASHGLLDAFTDAGLGIGFWLPFSNERYFFPLRPLTTSSLGVGAFFSGRAVAILANEILWIWLPVLAGLAALALGRRMRPGARG